MFRYGRTEAMLVKFLTSVEGPTLYDRKTHEEIITPARGKETSMLA
jgi:hypothetical protein